MRGPVSQSLSQSLSHSVSKSLNKSVNHTPMGRLTSFGSHMILPDEKRLLRQSIAEPIKISDFLVAFQIEGFVVHSAFLEIVTSLGLFLPLLTPFFHLIIALSSLLVDDER